MDKGVEGMGGGACVVVAEEGGEEPLAIFAGAEGEDVAAIGPGGTEPGEGLTGDVGEMGEGPLGDGDQRGEG